MAGASGLPPGFHFFPSDEELIVHFLRRKASLIPGQPDIVPTLFLNQYNPWELNGKALQSGNQWYFFSHAKQSRTSRNGYWDPTATDETVISSGGCSIGLKKTLIFFIGEPHEGIRTNWVMHEYHLMDESINCHSSSTSGTSSKRPQKKGHSGTESNNWVICRVYESSYSSQVNFREEGTELSCLDEVFLSLDDYDEVSLPNH